MPSKIGERVARLEERQKTANNQFKEFRSDIKLQWSESKQQFKQLSKLATTNSQSIKRINGELSDMTSSHERLRRLFIQKIDGLEKLVNNKVKPPMTGRDRAIFYGTTITAACSLAGTIIIGILTFLG